MTAAARARLGRALDARAPWAYRTARHLVPSTARVWRQLQRDLVLPALPRTPIGTGSVWAVGMVKDEEDIIETTVRHLLGQGVDHILIADNLSSDHTPQILERLARDHPVYLAEDRNPAYYQALKMDLLADAARKAGAEWIVPVDADELWFATADRLGDHLRSATADILTADIHNLFPSDQRSATDERTWRLEVKPHAMVKVAFRAHAFATLEMGNHRVHRPGAASGGLKICHIPWRSEEQFVHKVRAGASALSATTLPEYVGEHWRDSARLDDSQVSAAWRQILRGKRVEGAGWFPQGPHVSAYPPEWATWDPHSLLT